MVLSSRGWRFESRRVFGRSRRRPPNGKTRDHPLEPFPFTFFSGKLEFDQLGHFVNCLRDWIFGKKNCLKQQCFEAFFCVKSKMCSIRPKWSFWLFFTFYVRFLFKSDPNPYVFHLFGFQKKKGFQTLLFYLQNYFRIEKVKKKGKT